jgi:hypothetical protein
VLCCVVLCCVVFCCVVLCCVVLCCVVLSCVVLSCPVQYCLVLSSLVLPCLALPCLVLSCLALCIILLPCLLVVFSADMKCMMQTESFPGRAIGLALTLHTTSFIYLSCAIISCSSLRLDVSSKQQCCKLDAKDRKTESAARQRKTSITRPRTPEIQIRSCTGEGKKPRPQI